MNNFALIVARRGSKSILNKNLQKIGGKSLIEIAVSSAKSSGIFHRIILSTDIETAILDHTDDMDIIVDKRDDSLCQDDSLMVDVVSECIKKYNIDGYCWLLQPTSPFRVKDDYINILSTIKQKEPKSIISVTDVGPNHPNRMYSAKEGRLYPLRFTGFANKQELPKAYQRSGHYYVFKSEDFLKQKNFYMKNCYSYEIHRQRSVNIDDVFDLTIARLMYGAGLCVL